MNQIVEVVEKVLSINDSQFEQIRIDPLTKFTLLTQQVLFEMEAKMRLNESTIPSALDEISRIIAKQDSLDESDILMSNFVEIDFLAQLLKFQTVEYRPILINFTANLIRELKHEWISNTVILNQIYRMINDFQNEDSLVKLEYCLAVKMMNDLDLLQLFYNDLKFPIYDHLIQFSTFY